MRIPIDNDQRQQLRSWIGTLQNTLQEKLNGPVSSSCGGHLPQELIVLGDRLWKLLVDLGKVQENPHFALEDSDLPIVKRALLTELQKISEEQARLRKNTFDADIRNKIDAMSSAVKSYLDWPEIKATTAFQIPSVTKFLTLARAYSIIANELVPGGLHFDSKFGVLQAQVHFLPALKSARLEAGIRGNSVCVAFIDVDNFGDFNTKYTEARIDRDFLPGLMQLVETHVHSHGWAYLFGGDEFVLILPNINRDECQSSLFRLQEKVAQYKPVGISESVTFSGGFCCLDYDSELADDQVLSAASAGKKLAKTIRNAIAFCNSPIGEGAVLCEK